MILGLAETFGLRTVAEGVETESQRALLRALGCTTAQGYLFAPAVDAEDFEAMLTGPARGVGRGPAAASWTPRTRTTASRSSCRSLPEPPGGGRGGAGGGADRARGRAGPAAAAARVRTRGRGARRGLRPGRRPWPPPAVGSEPESAPGGGTVPAAVAAAEPATAAEAPAADGAAPAQ